jgi:CSLREA domain-containing protein
VLGVVGLLLAAPEIASAATPRLELRAPSHAAVGQPFELTLRVEGARNAAGFEARLAWDKTLAEFFSVDFRQRRLQRLGGSVQQLGPNELPNGVAFGTYWCPTGSCGPRDLVSPGVGARGSFVLARVRVQPNRAGKLEFRLSGGELVAPDGTAIGLARGKRSAIVSVGSGRRLYEAPRLNPSHGPRIVGKLRIQDLSGDRRVTQQDVTEAARAWVVARTNGGICRGSKVRAFDANRDGCIDVADVQAYAGKVATRSLESMAIAASNPPLVVDSVGDASDAIPGDGACLTGAGTCTLRAAIEEANAEGGANEIDFAIPGSGVQTIQLGSVLPSLNDTSGPTTIDGYTQPGASSNTDQYASNAQIRIQVRGTGSHGIDGLPITSANNVVTGLAFFNLRTVIWLQGLGSTGNWLRGDFIGTNAAGTFGFAAADLDLDGIGVEFSAGAHGNHIGDTTLAGRNVISGNSRHGVSCYDGSSNILYNNIVGLSPLGDRRLQNVKHGSDWNGQCSNNVIGGTESLQRNIFSGNGVPGSNDGSAGVEVSHGPGNTGQQVIGNCFGTDVTCTTSLSWTMNAFWGIHIEDTASNMVVDRNVVVKSPNGAIKLEGLNTSNNRLTNNLIGVAPDGSSLPNSLFGVLVADRASGNVVGPGNVIANNPVGVWVTGTNTQANTHFDTITRNSIFSNNGLGIRIDAPANDSISAPGIAGATTSAVTGSACAGCTVEVFVAQPDPSGAGEGKTLVGSGTASSSGDFTVPISSALAGEKVTATATDAGGNTSQFSVNTTVQSSGGATIPLAPLLNDAAGGDGSVVLQWSPPASDGGATITNYKIYRGTASGGETLLTQVGNVTSYTDATAANGTTYWYRIKAVNSVGEGLFSSEFSAVPGPVLVTDQFERTVANGLGTADVGGPWNVSSTLRTSVSGGQGIISGWSSGGQDVQAWIPAVTSDMQVLALVRLNAANPTGANYQARVVARAQSDTRNGYVAKITHTPAGAANWTLQRVDNGGGTGTVTLGQGTLLSSGAAGSLWWTRLLVAGTTVKVKWWREGTSEPSAWTVTTTDSYWSTGQAALGVFIGAASTSPFPTTGFDYVNTVSLGATSPPSPTAPGAPNLTSATGADGSVSLQWSAPGSDGGAPITNYNIYRGTASGNETLLTQVGSVTTYTDSAVTNGTTYYYKVSAVNSVGEGAASNERSATPVASTVLVSDQFERTVASGFGSADVGGPWDVSSTSRTKVTGGQGVIYGWTGGGQDVQASNSTIGTNMEVIGVVQLNASNPVKANYQARLVARAQTDARNGYVARITHTNTGSATWALVRMVNAGGASTVTLGQGTLAASGAAGSRWWIRLRASGTTIQARFWRDGTSEPSAWTVTTTDSFWTSGRPSLGAFVASGISSPFPQVGFDNLQATNPG